MPLGCPVESFLKESLAVLIRVSILEAAALADNHVHGRIPTS